MNHYSDRYADIINNHRRRRSHNYSLFIIHYSLAPQEKIRQQGAAMPPLGAVFLVYGLVVGVHNAVVAAVVAVAAEIGIALRRGVLIQLLGDLVEGLLHFLDRSLDGSDVGTLVQLLQLIHAGLDGSLFIGRDLVAQLAQGLFGLIDDLIGLVVGVDLFLAGLILGGVLLSLADSLVDVLLAQVGGSGKKSTWT